MDQETIQAGFSVDRLVELLTNNPPWWIYLVIALIPMSVLYILRESCCWFWKVNRLVDSLERIERQLASASRPKEGETAAAKSSKDEPFTLA